MQPPRVGGALGLEQPQIAQLAAEEHFEYAEVSVCPVQDRPDAT